MDWKQKRQFEEDMEASLYAFLSDVLKGNVDVKDVAELPFMIQMYQAIQLKHASSELNEVQRALNNLIVTLEQGAGTIGITTSREPLDVIIQPGEE